MSLTYEATPEWSVFVSESDKEVMRLHLFVTSIFVFCLAALVLFAMAWRSRRSGGGRRGKAKGDARGEMEMLPNLSEGESDEV
jgi:hypothetical protein